MDSFPSRRRVLQTTGALGAASLAGCSQLDSSDDPDGDDDDVDDFEDEGDADPDEEPDIDPEDGIAAIVEPDEEQQAELMAREQELMEEIEQEDISQEEAIAELEEMQTEMNEEAIGEFESYTDEIDGLTIEGRINEIGLLLVDGDDGAILDALKDGAVGGLFPGGEFEAAQNPEPQEGP